MCIDMISNKISFSLFVFLITVTSAFSQTYSAPGSLGNIIISSNETIGGSGTLTFNSLSINGGTLTIPAGVTVVVNGKFENKSSGTVIVNGELVLNGTNNQNKSSGSISGSGTLTASEPLDNKSGATAWGTSGTLDCSSGCNAISLPVELLYFEARFNEKVILTWSTATEINNEYFSIERSDDGVDFYEIAKIAGHGNTTKTIEYQYEDDNYQTAVAYYRLTQIDFDGQYEVFNAVRVETNIGNTKNAFKIFPTVVTQGKVTIQGEKPFQVKAIQVYSLSGTSSGINQPNASEIGSQKVEVNMSGLGTGLYLLKMISAAGDELTSRVVIP